MPTTGFEQRNYNGQWTTFAEESEYINELLSVTSIQSEIIGQGATGLDLMMYKIGNGPRNVLLLAQVHAPELSGRDALLSLMREWANSSDPEFLAYLEQVTLLIIPTARPDSQTVRNNANNVNLNRDHIRNTQPETRAIQKVVTDYSPAIGIDIHEGANISANYATHKAMNPNTHDGILNLSAELEQHVKSSVEADGFTWEPYQNHNISGPEYGHNSFALRNGVGLLLESMRVSSGDNIVETKRRYDSQVSAIKSILQWHGQNIELVDTTVASAKNNATYGGSLIELVNGTNTSGVIVQPLPNSYIITPTDYENISDILYVFGIESLLPLAFIPATNENRYIIHYLLDPESPESIVDAMRIYDESPPETPLINIDGIAEYKYKTQGVVYDANIM